MLSMKRGIRFFSSTLLSFAISLVITGPADSSSEVLEIKHPPVYHYPSDEIIQKLIESTRHEMATFHQNDRHPKASAD
jgi:hypothetical protein